MSGVVSGGGTPINGATVDALTNGTTTVAGTATANAQGQYSIALPPAIYDLRVTPPAGSGFNQETLQDIDLSASSQQVDVILISSGGGQTSPVTGTVRGLNGTALPSVRVDLYPHSGGSMTVLTDANGAYALQSPTGNANLQFQSTAVNSSAPKSWYLSQSGLAVGTGLVYDVSLPVAQVSGVVTDVGGNPVPGATLTASSYGYAGNSSWSANSSSVADASGAYSVLLLTGSASLTAQPPAGSPLGAAQVNVTLNGDTAANITLPATASVTGVVRGLGGQAISGVRVQAFGSGAGVATTTAADGSYTLNIAPGSTALYFTRNSATSTNVPSGYWEYYANTISVAGATTFNLDLPIVTVTGAVTSSANAPVANASVQGSSSGSDSGGSWYSSGGALTSASGTYTMLLFPGSANFTVRPPSGSTSASAVGSAQVTGDTVKDFVLPDPVVVSGTVRGIGGQPVAGATIFFSSSTGGVTVTADANGNYSVPMSPGTYFVQFYRGSVVSPAAPRNWTVQRWNVPVSGPTTLDLSLDVIRLTGQAQDSNGAPVPGVTALANTYRYESGSAYTEWYSDSSATTSASGAYSMLTLTGTGNVTIRPPTGSGFSQVNLSSVGFANNFTQRIVLQRPDTTAPVIVSGPAVLHLSDTSVSIGWTTNEPSTSIVDYGVGALDQQASSSALVTQHTVTLQGLTANEIYSFRVLSRDRNNNGPAQSGTDFFTMLAPPGDVTPPSILAGPAAAFTGDTSVVIQWFTNEPATSMVRWGATADNLSSATTVAPGEFVAMHGRLLSGLTPSTDYFAQVESTDPDGNQVQSSVFTFRTADAPDIQAPVVTSAPTVVARTHNAATIRWTTNEAATSGVSYNDGSVFNVSSSDTLTTTHEVVLAGLSPSRSYSFTAASKDAAGNGPTLSGPFTFTTLATPDVTPPVIVAVGGSVTKTTATLSWTTDEPASTVVRFGTISATLNQTVSDLALQTSHQVTLTGLLPGTTYFYALRSTDASGNTINTPEASVTTLPEDVNTPPTPPGPVTASPNPGNTGSFTITWGASADDGPGGVKEYVLLLGDTAVATLAATTTSYAASGVPEGSHTYRIRASDFSDATSLSDPITVVVDLTAPALTLPSPITTPATTNTDALVSYAATATDNIDPNPVVTCSPASGGAFPIGPTTVACSGRDAAGNLASGSFTVTVTDPFAPVLTVPADISLQAENQNGAVVNFTVTAADNHDPDPDVTCSPQSGSVFPVGITQVICTATDASGNSATRSFNVAIGAPPKVASTIAVLSSTTTTTFGQQITFTATVQGTGGSTPTGNVQFLDGTTVVGQAALAPPAGGAGSPTASLTIATLGAGTRSITASYAGDLGHESSTSPALSLEIGKAQPTIIVTGGTFTFELTPYPAQGSVTGVDGAAIGTLTFTYNGSTNAPVNAGTYAVVGSFAGNDNYLAGSANATITINPGGTHTVVQPGPSIVFGQSATIGVKVVSGTFEIPHGSVEFFDGVTSLGTVSLTSAGMAELVVGSLGVGTHSLTAVYAGEENFAGSVSAAAALEVARASTTTTLAVQPNPAGTLEAFKLTATVAVAPPGAGTAAGAVEFFSGPTALGSANLALVGGVPTAVLTLNGFPAGTYPLTARYAGNGSFAPSTSSQVSHTVRGLESSSWTVLTVSPTPSSRVNTNVTLRAGVVPLAGTVQPTGMVQFYAWGSPLGSPVALVNVSGTMTATLTTAALPSGLMQLRAHYLGSGSFSPSTSTPVSHTIYASTAPFATSTAMTVSANPSTFGESVTVTASVSSGTRPTPGYFLLAVDGVLLQAVPVVSGQPTSFVLPNLGRGLHGVTVQFYPTTTTLAGSLAHTFVRVQ